MIIEGGTGNGYAAKVTKENQIHTVAMNVEEIAFLSALKQDAYSIPSVMSNVADAACILFFRNTDPQKNFHIYKIILGASIAHQFDIYVNNTYAAGTGSAIVPTNLSLASGRVAICTALGNGAVTTITPGKQISRLYVPAGVSIEHLIYGAIVLGLNNDIAIVIKNASSTNTVGAIVSGYYKDTLTNQ